ncbi:AI-2E family transporter [Candidatus Woesearchaeota archaeon]|nr:AI-2E family transporter [Candidatus Woesearchaeota archaeon]
MDQKNSKKYLKYFFLVLFLFMLALAFMIVRPFMTTIIASIILSYIFYPLYAKINKRIKIRNISVTIVILIAILILTIPLFFVMNTITKESYVVYLMAKQRITSGEVFAACNGKNTTICGISDFTKDLLENPRTSYNLEKSVQKATNYVIDSMSNFIFSIPLIFLNFFILVFIMFYLIRDGSDIYRKFKDLVPLAKSHKERVLNKFNDVTYAVVYGTMIIALIQGSLGGLGLFIFGIPSPVLWGAMMIIAAMIPFLGPPVIWVPIVVLHLLNAVSANDTTQITKGIIMVLYFSLVVGTIDNILRPKIIGDRSQVHPVLILLGVVGGIALFGIIGIVIGPVILAIFTAFLQIYESEKGNLFFIK